MVLDGDILSVVLRYVDAIDNTPRTSTAEATAGHLGAECRRVSRAWRTSTEDAIGRALPSMASVSLSSLLAPGRLRFVLLSCRYHHEHGVIAAYNALVSRAEAAGLRLREAAPPRETTDAPSALLAANNSGAAGAMVAGARESGPPSDSNCSNDGGGGLASVGPSSGNRNNNCLCCRVALKRIVGEALRSPAFSWCSTLGPEDSRLLEGCVGALSLLQARWFSE
eukprot:g1918.t1